MELKKLLCALEERLIQHDNNRKVVQDKLQEICSELIEEADSLEERINDELHNSFDPIEGRILALIEKLNNNNNNDDILIKQVQDELSCKLECEIQHNKKADSFVSSYELRITKPRTSIIISNKNDIGSIKKRLREHLNQILETMTAAQNKLFEICNKRRKEAEKLKEVINEELEQPFTQEDKRIQEVVKLTKEKINDNSNSGELLTKAKLTLLVNQKYSIGGNNNLIVTKETSLRWINFVERKPSNVIASFTDEGEFSFCFTFFSDDEINVLKAIDPSFKVALKIWEKNNHSDENVEPIAKHYTLGEQQIHFLKSFKAKTTYFMKMRIEHSPDGLFSEWSDDCEFVTPEFKACVWKECPDDVCRDKKYSINEDNPRIATKISYRYCCCCSIIGNTPIPLSKITSWGIKILKSEVNDGNSIYIGIAPFDINQNGGDINKCGWYFNCYESTLSSGPPHNYYWKKYGLRKKSGEYVREGDSVGVVMDSLKGELSFVLNGVNLGVAYEGIPLDKPLVPCVILKNEGDSVELDPSEVKEDVDTSVSVPLHITTNNKIWDSITLTWDAVYGAEFYQIEVDGSKCWDASTLNTFTKRIPFPESEHHFKVRTVKGNKVSEWSNVVKGRTTKVPNFTNCFWRECPDDDEREKKYFVDENNTRIVTNVGCEYCTVIGSTYVPSKAITSWNIKILKSRNNSGGCVYIGVAPFDINQNGGNNSSKCGWYIYCWNSTLCSGPPHNYDREYGLRKKGGDYVHEGDNIGVIMDTTKGELSFALNEVNHGVAYEGIPLDKPLVPCVLLDNYGDSVELDLSEVKTNFVDTSIPVPSNITAKSITWDSIILTWDAVDGASFYQIEVDGSKKLDASPTSSFIKRGLFPESEYNFRVRTVKGNLVSEWSDVIKVKIAKTSDFSKCVWKECPDYVYEHMQYSVDENNPRIVTKSINNGVFCTIIGNAPLPLNKVTSWNIKVLKSINNDGRGIYIGIAPSDINQGEWDNLSGCGWYFYCHELTLWSGPPHKYLSKGYSLRGKRKNVHTGDIVGVVMDTIKGELSFILDGVNHGVAYEGIPLDKPLVPCVILLETDDSVELII